MKATAATIWPLKPGAAEDAGGVGVAGASSAGAVVDVGGPGVVAAACVRQGADRLAEAVVARPSEDSAMILGAEGLAP